MDPCTDMHLRHSSSYDVDELKQRLTKVRYGLGQSVIDDAMKWHEHLWACVNVKGGHFEHLV